MKTKTITIAFLMAIIFSTSLYSAEKQLQYDASKSLAPKIALTGVALAGVSDELAKILKDLSASQNAAVGLEEKKDILLTLSFIQTFRIICLYESEILVEYIGDIIESRNFIFLENRIRRLKAAKSEMEKNIELVKTLYFSISNEAALHLIYKAKETMYSALSLIEANIEVLEVFVSSHHYRN